MKRFFAIAILLGAMLINASAARNNPTNVDRVEPANWWVGMKNPTLQVMLHGDKIGLHNVALENAAGVTLEGVERTDNRNYLFLNLRIDDSASSGAFDIVLSLPGRKTARVKYELLERAEGSAERKSFDASDAIMLVMPDRFANADASNDDVAGMKEKSDRTAPYGRHGGDLKGIAQNLDYFVDLGMTALWLNPVQENDMPEASYHGYAITDYYAVDRRFGTLEDYKELTRLCHEKGLKMIMDMVFNHFGTSHKWIGDLPSSDWIFQWDGQYVNSNFRLSTVADPHVAAVDQRITTEGWFDRTMADINLKNPLARNYLIQNSIWWIETVGLDGIRQDTYPYPDKWAMREWNLRVREEYPNFNIVGETWIAQASKLCYWQKDFPNKDGYNSELPTIMDFALQNAISQAFNEQPSWDGGMMRIYDVVADDHLYPSVDNLLIFSENHDVGRLRFLMHEDLNKVKMATALIATMRGIPQLYVGTEVGMSGNGFAGHCNIREDFPGGWSGDETNFLRHDTRTGEAAEIYDYTARLFNFRKTAPALQFGQLTHFLPRNEVYVYFRTCDTQIVMVVINNSDDVQRLDMPIYADIVGQHIAGYDVVGEREVDMKNIEIEARAAMVIELK